MSVHHAKHHLHEPSLLGEMLAEALSRALVFFIALGRLIGHLITGPGVVEVPTERAESGVDEQYVPELQTMGAQIEGIHEFGQHAGDLPLYTWPELDETAAFTLADRRDADSTFDATEVAFLAASRRLPDASDLIGVLR